VTIDYDAVADFVLRDIFKTTDTWLARTSAQPPEVQTGSQLADDDTVTKFLQMSHVVTGILVSAVDHLNSLRALMTDAHLLPSHAIFTLVRTAHENAAVVVWLVSPSDRLERVSRTLSLALQDSRNADDVGALTGTHSTHQKRRVEIAKIAE
jgi:hypothetical protein